LFPPEGTPQENAYMQNEDYEHPGVGIEIQTTNTLKSNGTAFLPKASGGTDNILTDSDIIMPKDAGGVWDDVAGTVKAAEAINYLAKATAQSGDLAEKISETKWVAETVPYKNGPNDGKDTVPSPSGAMIERTFVKNPKPGQSNQANRPIDEQ
jgi:hypothetical protein